MKRSKLPQANLTEVLIKQMDREGLPPATREHRFHPIRRWRFDLAYPEHKPDPIAFEVEGGVWISGRHNRAKGFLGDIEKYNAAGLMGWRVFRIHGEMILKGNRQMDEGWELIQEVLECLGKSR